MKNLLQKSHQIVLSGLRSCYTDLGIFASKVNFSDYWARDTFWASLGMMEVRDENGNISEPEMKMVRKSLELFIKHQGEDGKIPRKICTDWNALKYVGIRIKRKEPVPVYTSPIKMFFSLDDNLLFIISFCRYIEVSGDAEFARQNIRSLERAMVFYNKKNLVKDELLYEIGLGNWMDTILKKGFVLYTNTLFYKALRSLEELSITANIQVGMDGHSSENVLNKIREKFWIEKKGYFADKVSKRGKKSNIFDLAGNVLALLFDVANFEEAEFVLDKINTLKAEEDKLHKINYPKYPFWRLSPVVWLVGIKDYHNQNSWSWLEALVVAAQIKYGRHEQAQRGLEGFASVIIENNGIHETYYNDGRPFDHRFWKSAVPFAWGAGLYLYAERKWIEACGE